MTFQSWDIISDLFERAAPLPNSQQRAFLEQHTDDPELIDEVLQLLEQDTATIPLLDQGLPAAAATLLDRSDEPHLYETRFGPYRLERLLGAGGMGTVFLARRDDLGKVAAIKILRDAFLSPARRDRFLQEQRTLSQLNHPLIAQLYDAGWTPEGTPWFAMEYIDGTPVTDFCLEHNLSLADRLRLFRQVCEAVRFAHERAVIHRDLKPANILVDRQANPKLVDFGIAKQLESLGDPRMETQTALRMMTPAFAAPEQVAGGEIGAFTDVFSLGIILYLLLTGRHPFEAERDHLSSLQGRFLAPSSLLLPALDRANVDWRDLDLLISVALHPDPLRRYRSAEALIRDLDHLVRSEPLEVRPDSLAYRATKFIRRNRRPLTLFGLAAFLAIASLTFFIVRLNQLRNSAVASALRAQSLQQFTQSLFDGGEKTGLPPRDFPASRLLSRGVEQANLLGPQPQAQADLYSTLGVLYTHVGDFSTADQLLHQSLAIDQAHRLDSTAVLFDLGMLRTDQEKLGEAERLVRRAIAQAQTARPSDPILLARLQTGLGRVLKELGQTRPALQVLHEAQQVLAPQGETLDLAENYKQQAESYFYATDYDQAASFQQRALTLHRRLLGSTHVETADDLETQAAIESNRGDQVAAERDFRFSAAAFERWYGPDDVHTAGVMAQLGKTLIFLHRYDEAEAILRKALSTREKSYGADHPYVANTLGDICRLYYLQDHNAEARSCYSHQVSIYRQALGDNHYLVAVSLLLSADVDLEDKQYKQAEATYRDVLKRLQTSREPDDETTGKANLGLGRALVKQERFDEALAPLRDAERVLAKKKRADDLWVKTARKYLAIAREHAHLPR